MTEQMLINLFTFHPPAGNQGAHYTAINEAAKEFALVILRNTPHSAEQTLAIRDVQRARMMANASIACDTNGFGV